MGTIWANEIDFWVERCPCNVVSFFLFNIRFNDDRDEGRVVDTVFDNFFLFLSGLNFGLEFYRGRLDILFLLEFGLELDFFAVWTTTAL